MIGYPNKQTEWLIFIYLLAWDPGAAKITKITPAVLPGNEIFTVKVDLLNVES